LDGSKAILVGFEKMIDFLLAARFFQRQGQNILAAVKSSSIFFFEKPT
jgi:hypothetical protein